MGLSEDLRKMYYKYGINKRLSKVKSNLFNKVTQKREGKSRYQNLCGWISKEMKK